MQQISFLVLKVCCPRKRKCNIYSFLFLSSFKVNQLAVGETTRERNDCKARFGTYTETSIIL